MKKNIVVGLEDNLKAAFDRYCNKKGLKASVYLRVLIFEELKKELNVDSITDDVINDYISK